jgi:uncharacterized membrane protein
MPIHPILVHFPIALFTLGALLLVLSYWKPALFRKSAEIVLAFGFVSGIVAYLSGDNGEEYARKAKLAGFNHAAVDKHETVAMLSMITFGALLATFVAKKFLPSKYWAILEVAFAGLGVALIILTGHYGGQMVYTAK